MERGGQRGDGGVDPWRHGDMAAGDPRGGAAVISADRVLETPRLSLAPPMLADFEDSAAMWGDESVTRHVGGKPSSREEAWARLHRYVGHWALLGYGYWTVRERASGRFVGEVGFADFRRGLGPNFDCDPECGWALAPWAQGKGFGSEAVLAVLAWGARNLGASRTVCMIHPDNRPSFRLAERCGFRAFAEARFRDAPTVLLDRDLRALRGRQGWVSGAADRLADE